MENIVYEPIVGYFGIYFNSNHYHGVGKSGLFRAFIREIYDANKDKTLEEFIKIIFQYL